ncbi:hypothetical protein FNH22_25010 [Fulvivirga sp. M361]|uniref:hypothetical protein n=1 Tax=Fulvivirga sp. M361 TaxID=2594266 RepID=UPI001179C1C1|nr:hypothetical protein [Fulvivirga sp. M361]TRX50915.1 hypothetical protein FNH22_25010 [Fulvivirga sp. M361]
MHQAKLYAVRSGKWKLHIQQTEPIVYWNKTEPLENPELYDIEADISEKYDRSSAKPEIVIRLKQVLKDHQADITDALPDNLAAKIEGE